jgi:hypothetical protein
MTMFDTLEYSENAQHAGFTKEQADFQAKELSKWINSELVTKTYMEKMKKEMIDLMTIRLGGIVVTCTGILGFILHK